jgi:hypothetical protein
MWAWRTILILSDLSCFFQTARSGDGLSVTVLWIPAFLPVWCWSLGPHHLLTHAPARAHPHVAAACVLLSNPAACLHVRRSCASASTWISCSNGVARLCVCSSATRARRGRVCVASAYPRCAASVQALAGSAHLQVCGGVQRCPQAMHKRCSHIAGSDAAANAITSHS